jgi:hypothetical protein
VGSKSEELYCTTTVLSHTFRQCAHGSANVGTGHGNNGGRKTWSLGSNEHASCQDSKGLLCHTPTTAFHATSKQVRVKLRANISLTAILLDPWPFPPRDVDLLAQLSARVPRLMATAIRKVQTSFIRTSSAMNEPQTRPFCKEQ